MLLFGTIVAIVVRRTLEPPRDVSGTWNRRPEMSAERDKVPENEQVVRRLYDCIQRNDATGFAAIVAETHTDHFQ